MYKKRIITITIVVAMLSCTTGCQNQNKFGDVALSRFTGKYWQIWTMRSDGKYLHQITNSPVDKRYPSWSKDGKSIIYTSNNKAYEVNNSMKERQLLGAFSRVGSPVQSPIDGAYLFARIGNERDMGDLWITSEDEKEQKIIVRSIGLQYPPAWSPNGKSIAYIAGGGRQPRELSIIDVNGINNRQITHNKSLEILPAYSPDSNSIVYASNITGNFEIWLIDIVSGRNIQLTFDKSLDTRPCWSPDGQKILFASRRSGNLQLWIMNKDGTSQKQVTNSAECIDPAWKME
jgi:TolB protein